MREHITFLKDIAKPHSFAQFEQSKTLRFACQYAVLVIAGAANHLPEQLRRTHPDIPWPNIIAIGHKLRHEYHRIDPDIVWGVMANHLDPLEKVVDQLLKREAVV